MGITNSDKDFIQTDCNGDIPYNVYLYWCDKSTMDSAAVNTIPFSHSGATISAQYSPYLTTDDLDLLKIPYHTEKFSYKADGSQQDLGDLKPFVYRIRQIKDAEFSANKGITEKILGQFQPYRVVNTSIGGKRSWRNESKLYNYPYAFHFLTDGIIEPMEIKPEFCPVNGDGETDIRSKIALNINADYTVFIANYKGDTFATMEGVTASPSRDYPVSSNQYAQWLATNKNQLETRRSNATLQASANIATGVASSLGGAVSSKRPSKLAAAGVESVGIAVSETANAYAEIRNVAALERDMRNIPNSLIARGNDVILNTNTISKALMVYHYRQDEKTLEKIGDYFAKFGYAQNKLMRPQLRSRKNYNFIKTVECNVNSNGVPKSYVEQYKQILNNGVTIWHKERCGTVNDYSKDNVEMREILWKQTTMTEHQEKALVT